MSRRLEFIISEGLPKPEADFFSPSPPPFSYQSSPKPQERLPFQHPHLLRECGSCFLIALLSAGRIHWGCKCEDKEAGDSDLVAKIRYQVFWFQTPAGFSAFIPPPPPRMGITSLKRFLSSSHRPALPPISGSNLHTPHDWLSPHGIWLGLFYSHPPLFSLHL